MRVARNTSEPSRTLLSGLFFHEFFHGREGGEAQSPSKTTARPGNQARVRCPRLVGRVRLEPSPPLAVGTIEEQKTWWNWRRPIHRSQQGLPTKSGLKRRLSKIPDTLLEDGFHRILAKDGMPLGDVCIRSGSVTVHNDYDGTACYDSTPKGAWFYILSRMTYAMTRSSSEEKTWRAICAAKMAA